MTIISNMVCWGGRVGFLNLFWIKSSKQQCQFFYWKVIQTTWKEKNCRTSVPLMAKQVESILALNQMQQAEVQDKDWQVYIRIKYLLTFALNIHITLLGHRPCLWWPWCRSLEHCVWTPAWWDPWTQVLSVHDEQGSPGPWVFQTPPTVWWAYSLELPCTTSHMWLCQTTQYCSTYHEPFPWTTSAKTKKQIQLS